MLEKVLEVYTKSDRKNYTVEELSKILECSEDEIKMSLKKLIKKDLIFKNGKDIYRLNTFFPTEEEQKNLKEDLIRFIQEKRIVSFKGIKHALHFQKQEQIIFLRKFLKKLEETGEIYHSKGRGFYSLEKINYLSKSILEEQILKIVAKYPGLSYKKLKKQLHLTKEDNEYLLITLLQELECDGKIYIHNNHYQKMPMNYRIANVIDFWGGVT